MDPASNGMEEARVALFAWLCAMRSWHSADPLTGRRAEWEEERHEVHRLYALWQTAAARAVRRVCRPGDELDGMPWMQIAQMDERTRKWLPQQPRRA